MKSILEARARLDLVLLERHAEGRPATVAQIDVELDPSGSCVANVWLDPQCDDDLIVISFDWTWPREAFDRHAIAAALLRAPAATLH